MRIAVVGCCHGKLNEIYEQVKESQAGAVDLVVICGDFQAVRGVNDLKCMAVPNKFKELGDFHAYYTGDKQATHLTLVIGGNHEASNYFQSLPYGGWIAPNIYYMGYSNVIRFNGLKIGGVSGIFKHYNTGKGHFEHLPYDSNTMKSAYHTRYLEVFRIMQFKDKLDIMLTHDWPLHVYNMPGAREYLIRKKKHFRDDINRHQLGSPMYEAVLNRLRPKHWFAAHLHVRFETNYVHQSFQNRFNNHSTNLPNRSSGQSIDNQLETKHSKDSNEISENKQSKDQSKDESEKLRDVNSKVEDNLKNEDEKPKIEDKNSDNQSKDESEKSKEDDKQSKMERENSKEEDINLKNEEKNSQDQSKSSNQKEQSEVTHFLALDKCLPRRNYFEFVEVESDESNKNGLEYDLEWLAILRCTNQYVSTQEYPSNYPPEPHILVNYDLDEHKARLRERLNDDLKIPTNFNITLPYNSVGEDVDPHRVINYVNEQTTTFCQLVELTDPMQSIVDRLTGKTHNPDKISISDEEESIEDATQNESKDEPNSKKLKQDTMFYIDTKGRK